MAHIYLKEMTYEMYHMFFIEYVNDMDLYLDEKDFHEYVYTKERVDQYIQKQTAFLSIFLWASALTFCGIHGKIKGDD